MTTFRHFLVSEAKKSYDYSSLMFRLPDDLSDDIISWGFDTIPDGAVYHEPTHERFGREDDIHVTLLYGIESESPKSSIPLFGDEPPLECRLGKISVFENEKFDVLVIRVECDRLARLHSKLLRKLEVAEQTHREYIPHVTIAYLKGGRGAKYDGSSHFRGREFSVGEVVFSPKKGLKKNIPLGGKK